MWFPIMDVSYKQNHVIPFSNMFCSYVWPFLFCQPSFMKIMFFKLHPCCSLISISFHHLGTIFYFKDTIHFVDPSSVKWLSGFFYFLSTINNDAITLVTMLPFTIAFITTLSYSHPTTFFTGISLTLWLPHIS